MTDADDTRQAAWKLFDGADGLVAYTVALAAEVKSQRAAIERVRELCAKWRQMDVLEAHEAAELILRALDGETPDNPAG